MTEKMEGNTRDEGKWSRRSVLLSFVLILLFDTVVIIFLFVVFVKQNESTPDNQLPAVVTLDGNISSANIFDVDIQVGMFDIVVLSLTRCLIGLVCYGVLRWITRLPIIASTLLSTVYIVAKAAVYQYNRLPPLASQPLTVFIFFFMLLSSVVVPWLATFFFEFKYLSGELAYYKNIRWSSWKAWLWPRSLKRSSSLTNTQGTTITTPLLPSLGVGEGSGGSGPSYHTYAIPQRKAPGYGTPYLTPAGSEGDMSSPDSISRLTDNSSNTTMESNVPLVPMSPEELAYKQKSDQTLQLVDQLLSPATSWILEKQDAENGILTYAYSKPKPKMLKVEALLPYNIQDVWTILYTEVANYPEWNTDVVENKVLYKITDSMDLLYTVCGPQAGGMISSRDFVSLRTLVSRPGVYMSLGAAVDFADMPPANGRIRGENLVSAYVVEEQTKDLTKLIWIVQTDLKGWLPKYLIDQALSSTLGHTLVNLRECLRQRFGPPAVSPRNADMTSCNGTNVL